MSAKKAKPRVKAGATKLSASQRRKVFAEAFLTNNENATDAAIQAGFSPKTAYQAGHRLLKHAEVQSILNNRRSEICAKLEITTERVLLEVARLALFDPRKLFDANGQPKPINELDDDTAAALAGLDIQEEFSGTGKNRVFIGYTKKYKIADKNSALEKLMKFKGLYEKDNSQKTDPLVSLLQGLSGKVLGVVQVTDDED